MEANYPYAIKDQRGARKIALVGGILCSKAPGRGLWMRGAGSLWNKIAGEAIPRNNPRHRGGPVWIISKIISKINVSDYLVKIIFQ